MKDKKVVVTGGLGFIGSHITEGLIENNEVTIIDDMSAGKLDNIKHLETENIDFIKGDITELNLKSIFDDKDYIFHEAAMASVPKSVEDPVKCNRINITGTLKVLVAAKDTDVKKVVLASSSAVYGDSQNMPLKEDEPLKPMSPYAVTKATGELYCNTFTDLYGLQTAALRYFNVFGQRQDPNSQYAAAIPNFIDKILKGERPVIYSDGEQSRDFIYIKNVVDANIKVCESNKTGIFNIGHGKKTTINELVKVINEVMETEVEPVYEDPRTGDIKHSLADVSKAKSFGFEPEDKFKDELRETVRWFAGGVKAK
ncbi:SDR family oxidoreductase [Methanobacterium paludis]|uniref:UDP-glucose 4-epimerase n=1 Tax=Methanobacterium paludis (strain DSM 25820 / JCM 18151 / SWAN1) TaxID=868131 RepID=F6D2M8_METPW|nr:SDR family oxidoreductase [Methanobacterium paludis]AEG17962.1 UDP-glucose 4-epimerase [Methanobacterium paludis]